MAAANLSHSKPNVRQAGAADDEEPQSVEADEHGAAFVADDAQRQGEGKTEGGEDQHDNDRTGEDEVLQQHPSCPPSVAE